MYAINIRKAFLSLAFVFVTATLLAQDLSDAKIKKNIEPIDNSLQRIMQLEPKKYEYNVSDFKHLKLQAGSQYGFIAEELQSIFPDLVKEKSVNYMFGKNIYRNATIKTIDEAGLIPVLVASVKEQQAEIEKLKMEVLQLKKQTASVQ
ncbi:MAG: tail fiber domain-containing protein [Chitinophagaceae bacterium]|nr:tail fiber domain-containing protein [Chitinophagaceae bacterium]